MMKWTRYMLLMPVLMVQALSSCSLTDEPKYDESDNVKVSLAFMVSSADRNFTRMADDVVQETAQPYRGIEILGLTPFAISGERVVSTDNPLRLLDNAIKVSGTTPTFYFYKSYTMMRGINAFLVYGRAPVGNRTKAENGSLLLPDLINPDLTNMRFTLEPISSQSAPDEASLLAGYLNNIAQAKVEEDGVAWSQTPDPKLHNLFLFFTGLQNEGNMVMAGSCANVMAHVNALYELIYGCEESDLRTVILGRIKTLPESGLEGLTLVDNEETDGLWRLTDIKIKKDEEYYYYPANVGLPDGAAALRWANQENGSYKFEPQIETSTLDNINNIGRFCYPAELFYYANSLIDTSNREVGEDVYQSSDWVDGVLSKYEYQPGVVTSSTTAVAIHDPLQYAVGRLKMSMIAETATETLKDAAGEGVPLTNPTTSKSSFPLTGVIICNQHPVDFNFKPVLNNGAASHVDDRFIYDTQVGTGRYLTTSGTDILSTLVLQTYDTGEGNDRKGAEEVTIAMEFMNNSGQKFYGKDCVIYPDTKFYLIGKIKPSEAAPSSETPEAKGRVFTQDHVTTVSTKVETLANAYNVLPDLIGGRLELGVELVSSWVQAETTNVILK